LTFSLVFTGMSGSSRSPHTRLKTGLIAPAEQTKNKTPAEHKKNPHQTNDFRPSVMAIHNSRAAASGGSARH
jgi:hypothetical protein